MAIGIIPFEISPIKVSAAAFFPAYRRILVVPGFPDPTFLGSDSLNTLLIIMALDIEPARYAKIINEINCIMVMILA